MKGGTSLSNHSQTQSSGKLKTKITKGTAFDNIDDRLKFKNLFINNI